MYVIFQPLAIILTLLILSGCQVVQVKQKTTGAVLNTERNNILTHNKLSEATLNTLSLTAIQTKECEKNAEACIQHIQNIRQISDERYLSAASEISLAYALQLKSSSSCNPNELLKKFTSAEEHKTIQTNYESCMLKQIEVLSNTIRYSYAYLFETQQTAAKRLFNNRQVQVKDFYNQATANLINAYNDLNQTQKPTAFKPIIDLGHTRYLLNTDLFPNLAYHKIDKLVSTYNLSFSGLKSVNRRDGFGSEFAIKFKPDHKDPFQKYEIEPLKNYRTIAQHPNIHNAPYIPVTIIIEPVEKGSIQQVLQSKDLTVKLIDPNLHAEAVIDQQNLPITANYSASYALWLADNNLGASAYWTLLDRESSLTMPQLFMLEPYQPQKKVIIMIHGLASSPEAWIDLTNNIMGDDTLRKNYQVWQIFYSTNMPIMESRYQIYALLKQTFTDLEKQYPQHPPRHAVLVGHSMGGVISRLLISPDNFTSAVIKHIENRSLNTHKYRHIYQSSLATKRFQMMPLTPQVDRAVFIAAPLQGTEYADRWFTLLARKIIKLPESFLKVAIDSLQGNLNEAAEGIKHISKEFLQNGPSDLSQKSAFMQITGKATISPDVKYHVIMGNNTKFSEKHLMSDGIVPYNSAHLEGAESETIIQGGHSIQYTPRAILELRKILHQHLNQHSSTQK